MKTSSLFCQIKMSSLLIIIKLLLCTIVCLAICKDVKSTLSIPVWLRLTRKCPDCNQHWWNSPWSGRYFWRYYFTIFVLGLNNNKFRNRVVSQWNLYLISFKEAVFETRFETRCTRDSCSTHAVTSQNGRVFVVLLYLQKKLNVLNLVNCL